MSATVSRADKDTQVRLTGKGVLADKWYDAEADISLMSVTLTLTSDTPILLPTAFGYDFLLADNAISHFRRCRWIFPGCQHLRGQGVALKE